MGPGTRRLKSSGTWPLFPCFAQTHRKPCTATDLGGASKLQQSEECPTVLLSGGVGLTVWEMAHCKHGSVHGAES